MRKRNQGFTLVELVLAVALTGILMLLMSQVSFKMIAAYQRSSTRAELDADARNALMVLTRMIQLGNAGTTLISTPTASDPPFSRIDFDLAADPTIHYAFYFAGGMIQMQVTRGTQVTMTQIATHVTALNFTGNAQDPSYVNVSVRLDAPVGQGLFETAYYPNQIVHMVTLP